ncbi:nucleotidyltransferase domain-containing protein [Odoribacter splanchnicus]|uniref:nucleotidyltransferase domain-containing protein n=1 Tax=Odoribacter splanchnicus TaxID=28118 RepID=UPI001E3D9E0C|nr:nucleotidyltransferase domain-containing protein [Odoribacter splanchnicus]
MFLLGSCTNNSKRDGDFDLLVRSTGEKKGILERVRMVTRLKLALGDRKVDVIGDYEDNAVVQKALLHGIRLI